MNIGIVGYGNLGKGAEEAVCRQEDMTLAAIFSHRQGIGSQRGVPVYPMEQIHLFYGKIDVLILCGGSARDLPQIAPELAKTFAIVDSYDNHERAKEHIAACQNSNHSAIVCVGWDPGLFSIQRVLCKSLFPQLEPATFWGPGISQGHSDAIRQIAGVLDARQYTIPKEGAIRKARKGEILPKEKAHRRVCHVAVCEKADQEKIRKEISSMPSYFAPYETAVHFVPKQELGSCLSHGGKVIGGAGQMEFTLALPSNPQFTGAVLTAYARAAYRLEKEGNFGAKTPLDVPVSYLCPSDAEVYI